jgi:hypothetical protein
MTRKRTSKNGACITYVVPQNAVDTLLNGGMTDDILMQYKARERRVLVINDLIDQMTEHSRPYVYAAWFGINAEIFQIVHALTGEVIEKEYITWQVLEDGLGYDLTHNKVILYVY